MHSIYILSTRYEMSSVRLKHTCRLLSEWNFKSRIAVRSETNWCRVVYCYCSRERSEVIAYLGNCRGPQEILVFLELQRQKQCGSGARPTIGDLETFPYYIQKCLTVSNDVLRLTLDVLNLLTRHRLPQFKCLHINSHERHITFHH